MLNSCLKSLYALPFFSKANSLSLELQYISYILILKLDRYNIGKTIIKQLKVFKSWDHQGLQVPEDLLNTWSTQQLGSR